MKFCMAKDIRYPDLPVVCWRIDNGMGARRPRFMQESMKEHKAPVRLPGN